MRADYKAGLAASLPRPCAIAEPQQVKRGEHDEGDNESGCDGIGDSVECHHDIARDSRREEDKCDQQQAAGDPQEMFGILAAFGDSVIGSGSNQQNRTDHGAPNGKGRRSDPFYPHWWQCYSEVK